jgi:hypothetical protein
MTSCREQENKKEEKEKQCLEQVHAYLICFFVLLHLRGVPSLVHNYKGIKEKNSLIPYLASTKICRFKNGCGP